MPDITHLTFATTSPRGLRQNILPMRLYQKSKKLGVWDPQSIDFTQDIFDWQHLNDNERDTLLYLTALFQAGEECVTLDLLPLIMAIAQEGHIEEELYLTSFLWEEAKHTEFFRRFLDEVAHEHSDLAHYHTPSYRTLFYEELPRTMHALLTDRSSVAQARAATTYNMIIEGVLAETGYHGYFFMLQRNNIMPGLQQGISYIKRDESRHLAYGVFLISRLVAADPSLWPAIEQCMNELLMPALSMVHEVFADSENLKEMPFGLQMDDYLNFAMTQFSKRVQRIQRAREQTLEQLYQTTEAEVEVE